MKEGGWHHRLSGNVTAGHGRQFQQQGIPIVAVDNQTIEDYQFSISHDHYFGSCQLSQHLLDMGHSKIAYLAIHVHCVNRERQRGFLDRWLRRTYRFLLRIPSMVPTGGEPVKLERIIFLRSRTSNRDCVFQRSNGNRSDAQISRSNLSIPSDCSVVGFDNIAISAYMVPPLTTFEQPKYKLGYAAACMMMNLLNQEVQENQTTKTEVLRGTLIIRESTVPPKG